MLKKKSEPTSFTDAANVEGLSALILPKKEIPKEPTVKRDIPEYDAAAKPGRLVPKRRWHCRNRTNCKGRVAWTGWEQLGDERPVCPICGGETTWFQWLVRE